MQADMTAVKAAVQQLLAALDEGEMGLLKSRGPAKVEVEVEGGQGMAEECAACAAGECANPEHASEEDMAGVEAMYR